MEKQQNKLKPLRQSVDTFFSTVDNLLEKGKLTPADQDWLEKELEEMEQKLRAYKLANAGKVAAE